MKCRECEKEFIPNPNWHYKWGICPDCRPINHRKIKVKYKKTEKGIENEHRWRKNPVKKEIDKKSRSTKHGKHLAVLRTTKYLKNSEYGQQAKKRASKIYLQRTQGRLRKWWQEASKNGCVKCGSFDGMGIDHIIPKSKGGDDVIENYQVLCRKCNGIKGVKIED